MRAEYALQLKTVADIHSPNKPYVRLLAAAYSLARSRTTIGSRPEKPCDEDTDHTS